MHVGRDFVELRRCGLTLYSDALMRAQQQGGHEVSYFFAGRYPPRISRPRLKRWARGPIAMFELVGSPITSHWTMGTRDPLADVEEPAVQGAFAAALREARPEIVHIHELTGLPSSVIRQAGNAGASVVMTLHDYTPICATTRLLDSHGERCLRKDVGEDCARNCAGAPAGSDHLVDATLQYEIHRGLHALPLPGRLRARAARAGDVAIGRRAGRREAKRPPSIAPAAPPSHYQRRRDTNIRRLNECERLVAPSRRVAEIYAHLGVAEDRIAVQRLTVPHIERLTPNRGPEASSPLVFATLGSATTASKGALVLAEALRLLTAAGRGRDYRLLVFGSVMQDVRPELESNPSVSVRGPYLPESLDTELDEADVGLMPSIWEEVHGFAGIEMLAKGLPVIGSELGGIPEYVRDGQTGWLNQSAGARELAELMMRALDNPAEVEALRRSVRAQRGTLVRTMADHVAEVEEMYLGVAGDR
jgi:glycosyltransferase involved in cell wall biosynthesis